MAVLRSRRRQTAGDEALVRSLYEEHGRALLAYATRLTGDRAAAEDVVQETLVRAWRHPEVLVNGKGSVRGWLLTVARNIVTDRARARAARPIEVAESPGTPPIQGDHADTVVDTVVVLAALEQLSGQHRDVLVELYFRGRSVTEAASALGIPPRYREITFASRIAGAARSVRRSPGRAEGGDGMSTGEQHPSESLGAYALGALDQPEARAVDEHVASCTECRAQLDELAAMATTLGEVPPEAFLDGPPDGGDLLLRRTLRQIRTEHESGRWARRLIGFAAAVVAVVIALGGGVLLGRDTNRSSVAHPAPVSTVPSAPPNGTRVVSGSQQGFRLAATITPAAGWVRLHVSVSGIPAGRRCELVVVSKSGDREVAGSWLVSKQGEVDGTKLDGAALVAPDQVASIEVRDFAGHTLVSASA